MNKINIPDGEFMKTTKYLSIYNELKNKILDGTFPIQSKLPSKRKLSSFYNVSVMTVDTAYQQLIAEGYVISYERKGYFVNDLPEHRFFDQSNMINRDNHQNQTTNIIERKKTTYFPHQIWAKISRKVLSDEMDMMDNQLDPEGLIGLRYEIKKYLEIYRGIIASVDQIVIGSGSQAMIQLIIAIIGRNYTFVMEEPGFPRLKSIIRHSGINLMTKEIDHQGIMIHQLNENQPTILHVTPSHQYPMGVIMPIARRIECLNWANSQHHRYILEDDYDSEFRYQGLPIPALQSLDQSSKVIYMNTFSKSLSPSLKINYLVIPKSLLNVYQDIKFSMPCSVPIFEQKVLMTFMKEQHFERHLNKVKKIYRKKALMIIEALREENHIQISGYESGLHMVLSFDPMINVKKMIKMINQKNLHLKRIDDYYDHRPKDCYDFMFEYAALSDTEISKTLKAIKESLHAM